MPGVREIDPRTCPDADLLELHAIEQACLVDGEPPTGAEERLEGYPEAAARWTEEPRTATRTVRLRGTCRPSVPAAPGRR